MSSFLLKYHKHNFGYNLGFILHYEQFTLYSSHSSCDLFPNFKNIESQNSFNADGWVWQGERAVFGWKHLLQVGTFCNLGSME